MTHPTAATDGSSGSNIDQHSERLIGEIAATVELYRRASTSTKDSALALFFSEVADARRRGMEQLLAALNSRQFGEVATIRRTSSVWTQLQTLFGDRDRAQLLSLQDTDTSLLETLERQIQQSEAPPAPVQKALREIRSEISLALAAIRTDLSDRDS